MSKNIENIRHSLSHILAMAVLDFWPEAKLGIGPTIENGFYYDFALSAEASGKGGITRFSSEDLQKIEKKMKEIISQNIKFEKKEVSVEEAKKIFQDQPFKLGLIEELKNNKQQIIIYQSGGFTDLCTGPHINSTKELNPEAFKLTKVAGAYWKGSEKNPQLQRIYGVGFATKKELETYLKMLEEAEKRDHRKLGKELEIFMFSEEVGQGLPLWLPKGMIIRDELEKLAKQEEEKEGYVRVWTPHIGRAKLYEMSGHLPYFQEEMYPAIKTEDDDYYLKPMNCPHHYMIYKQKPRSYRDLPMRIAEYGTVYRYEKSGELLGLLRPRAFTQNDAHIICSKEQIKEEFLKVMKMHTLYYKLFGIKNFYMRLSLRDPKNTEKFIDNREMWEYSEKILKEAMEESKLPYRIGVGEASFYGPKVDFQIKSAIGKEYSASTNQLDFAAGLRFNLTFADKKGEEETAFVIHRSPLGSHERFIGFLIEHYGGAFPFWLSPEQIWVIPIGAQHKKYAREIGKTLGDEGFRFQVKDENETVSKKIRGGEIQKIPYLLIVGDKEIKAKKVSVRERHKGDIGQMPLKKFLEKISEEIERKK